jgi:hypothetical protein
MTQQEFDTEYSRLVKEYPNIYGSQNRTVLIAQIVKDFDVKWFRALVNRIILNPHERISIEEIARSERNAKAANLRAKGAIGEIERLTEKISDEGYQKVLKAFGNSNSLLEAVENAKRSAK